MLGKVLFAWHLGGWACGCPEQRGSFLTCLSQNANTFSVARVELAVWWLLPRVRRQNHHSLLSPVTEEQRLSLPLVCQREKSPKEITVQERESPQEVTVQQRRVLSLYLVHRVDKQVPSWKVRGD